MGRTSRKKNIYNVFKNFLGKTKILLKKKKNSKKVDFFSCDFKIFDGTIGCAKKFHSNEIYIFFFLSLLDQKL